MVAAAERLYTVEEFWTLPEDMTDGCELIDGRLVKKHVWDGEGKGMTPPMYNHARVAGRVDRRIGAFADQHGLGEVLHGPAIIVGANRERMRKPDLALFVGEPPVAAEAIYYLVPAFAIEIISPNNTAADMFSKVEEYLAAGVRLVWQMFPERRSVIAFAPDQAAVFRPGDTITAEPVLPGFACAVDDLFPSSSLSNHAAPNADSPSKNRTNTGVEIAMDTINACPTNESGEYICPLHGATLMQTNWPSARREGIIAYYCPSKDDGPRCTLSISPQLGVIRHVQDHRGEINPKQLLQLAKDWTGQ